MEPESNTKIEIIKVVKKLKEIDKFILDRFEPANPENSKPNFWEYDSNYPIYPYKINLRIIDSTHVRFCGLPIIDCLALKTEKTYTFFIILKDKLNTYEALCDVYGPETVSASAQVEDNPSTADIYGWDFEGNEIWLKNFRNWREAPNYDYCDIVIIGNAKYDDIVVTS